MARPGLPIRYPFPCPLSVEKLDASRQQHWPEGLTRTSTKVPSRRWSRSFSSRPAAADRFPSAVFAVSPVKRRQRINNG